MLHSIYALTMSRRPAADKDMVLNTIEDVRARAGLSRQELAERVGVHYQTIGYLERGEYSPSLVLALRLSRELRMPVDSLFRLQDEEVTNERPQ